MIERRPEDFRPPSTRRSSRCGEKIVGDKNVQFGSPNAPITVGR
jgi:hypothetical protein